MTDDDARARRSRKHLLWGWRALGVYLALGIALEVFHATKAGFYLDAGQETRRFLFRLAHAHGTLLAIVNVLYALTDEHLARRTPEAASPRLASPALLAALFLIPAGFFAGGLTVHGADPGLGVALVPPGAAALLLGVFAVARAR